MRIASDTIGTLVAVVGTLIASGVPVRAATCGDANRTGTVTVTDGVLVLRAAAQLPVICPRERCDMNIDGGISVTDGVLALRVAADIQTQVACSANQADVIFGQIVKNTGAGRIASPAGRARAAGTTEPCPGGGSTEDTGAVVTYTDCRAGDFVTNGTLEFSSEGSDTVSVFFDTTDFVVSTGETIDTFGALTYTFGDVTRVDGVLTYASTLVGAYTDEYSNVLLDANFLTLSGTVTTTVTDGRDFFANIAAIETFIYSPALARIYVTYASGDFDLFTLADGLCEPCGSGCSNASLACVSCVDQCAGGTDRCSIDFDVVDCNDGLFGPSGLCVPCTSDTDCNTGDGLSCFACDQNCSGTTQRCGSSLAYVECADGAF
jgi:hypothetical protein